MRNMKEDFDESMSKLRKLYCRIIGFIPFVAVIPFLCYTEYIFWTPYKGLGNHPQYWMGMSCMVIGLAVIFIISAWVLSAILSFLSCLLSEPKGWDGLDIEEVFIPVNKAYKILSIISARYILYLLVSPFFCFNPIIVGLIYFGVLAFIFIPWTISFISDNFRGNGK